MEKRGWKILAIVLLLICAYETYFIISAYNYGIDLREKDATCNNICLIDSQGYDSYLYDAEFGICNCYKDKEVMRREVLK